MNNYSIHISIASLEVGLKLSVIKYLIYRIYIIFILINKSIDN